MLVIVTVLTVVPWLALGAMLAAPSSQAPPAAGDGPPRPAGPEPPAVVSLLAGRLASHGYPATLLDLAARGWFRLEARAGGPVMCVLTSNRTDSELTAHERRVYIHLVTRAADRPDIPAAALADGFASAAAVSDGPAGEGAVKSARDAFMEAFTKDVIEDSRRRGLTRPRLSEAAGCLLWAGAVIPAIVSGVLLHAHHGRAYWIPIAGFFALCVVSGVAIKSEKLTPAGRAALRGWRDRCGGPAATRGAGDGWPHRGVAYAAALGRERQAVKLFSGTPGDPPRKAIWSSYGGYWRQITISDPQPRSFLQAGGSALFLLAIVLAAVLPPTLATVLLAHGEIQAAALGVLACDVAIALLLLTKNSGIPVLAEFDGRVIEAWIEEVSSGGENSTTSTRLCLAIDDGVRDQAWAFVVSDEQYRRFAPGTVVHARVNPRGNTLLDIRPIADAR